MAAADFAVDDRAFAGEIGRTVGVVGAKLVAGRTAGVVHAFTVHGDRCRSRVRIRIGCRSRLRFRGRLCTWFLDLPQIGECNHVLEFGGIEGDALVAGLQLDLDHVTFAGEVRRKTLGIAGLQAMTLGAVVIVGDLSCDRVTLGDRCRRRLRRHGDFVTAASAGTAGGQCACHGKAYEHDNKRFDVSQGRAPSLGLSSGPGKRIFTSPVALCRGQRTTN